MESELENQIGATFEEDLDQMLPKCDIILINTPLTDKTKLLQCDMVVTKETSRAIHKTVHVLLISFSSFKFIISLKHHRRARNPLHKV
ncbi:unnamed protein product [Lactuca virosa]|uniref:Uncharacterized protein n=1 Tax=Lactuca virosa TaxID=75947 RepID=A0AAU9LRX5_9ASTR|nr:unnamed protein product [Lactuca virosa]